MRETGRVSIGPFKNMGCTWNWRWSGSESESEVMYSLEAFDAFVLALDVNELPLYVCAKNTVNNVSLVGHPVY